MRSIFIAKDGMKSKGSQHVTVKPGQSAEINR